MEIAHKALIPVAVLFFALTAPADTVDQAYKLVSQGRQMLAAGRPIPAKKAFRQALGMFPGWYKPMLGLAAVELQAGGSTEKAWVWVDKALRLEPGRWAVQFVAGRVMEAAGHPRKALRHYLKAFDLAGVHRDQVRDFACGLVARWKGAKKCCKIKKLKCKRDNYDTKSK